MTDTYYAHTLNWTEKYFRGKYIYRRYDQGRQIKSSSSWSRYIVTPDEVFEAFIGFDDELAMDNNEYLNLIEQSRMDLMN